MVRNDGSHNSYLDSGIRRYFRTSGDNHPWLAIDLIIPHEITGIEIFEREYKDADRTNNIEVRVGDTKPFNANNQLIR